MSEAGMVKLTQPWEEFVPFPYDDKRRKCKGPDGWAYPEWKGGGLIGTLTIGYGHTNAAGPIRINGLPARITPGMRVTEAQAIQIMLDDLAPCERHVDQHLKVEVTQHQYDCLVDLDFNCPSAIPHVCRLVNAGDWAGAARVMLEYVYSKGEYMRGLVRRRTAEIDWAHTHDDPEHAAPAKTPKGEKKPAPNIGTHVAVGGGVVVAAGTGLVPHDLLVHSDLLAGLCGGLTAFFGGLFWHSKWKR